MIPKSWDTLSIWPYLPESPSQCLQLLFGLATCAILAIAVVPSAERKLLLDYGARNKHGTPAGAGATKNDQQQQQPDGQIHGCPENFMHKTIRLLTSIGQVPHALFFIFYATYLASTAFWAAQYFQDGTLLRDMSFHQMTSSSSSNVTSEQVTVAWFLMVLQASRRLWECKFVMKPSKSTMWFVHWVMGLAFYLGVSVAIWIEGSGAVLQRQLLVTGSDFTEDAKLKIGLALPLFIFSSIMQYRCHQHLASLKKYSLPNLGMFRHIVSPHYTCECLIYFSLAVLASPEGYWCNRSLLSVLLFVAVNLGITAHGTRHWYNEKFGESWAREKWTMIPLLF